MNEVNVSEDQELVHEGFAGDEFLGEGTVVQVEPRNEEEVPQEDFR